MQDNKKARLFDLRRFPQDMARLVCAPLLLIFRMKKQTATGEKYKKRIKGGAIIAANHTSLCDPFLVGTAVWYRRLFFLAAEAVMSGRLKAALLRGAGAIKIDRQSADIEAIKKSVEVLKAGHLLAVFPEGGIQSGEGTHAIKSGVVLIALRAGVPIIPVHIKKSDGPFSRRRVIFGNEIRPADHISGRFPSTAEIERVTALLMDEMMRLGECK